MAARGRKPGGAGSKKKRGIADGGTPEEKLSSALQTLAATRAELNRAELRASRAESSLVTSREELAEQSKRAEAAEIMTRRIREEQSSALREQLTRYDDKLKALAKSATDGHEQAMRLFEERAALLKRLEATEAQRDNLQHMADAERNLREKLEELQKQASERLDDFIAKSKPLIEENKRLATANASLNDKAVALQERLKAAAEQQAESMKLLTESRIAMHRMEQSRKTDAEARRKLLKRVEKAEGLATDALQEAVGDKKELARLLRRERQLTQLADLMQARVADLEKQRDDALAGRRCSQL
ncbi:hypothetical protein FNF28_07362 [Cafeteria roenbergensis]|uniref:Uncharacterized protein n=1 Tax=Cafeteria roenbergensis TaxID=33653 RepID=A0A5A8C9M4_CAFRO|nr:hypothetical protein FNF28_07362 [Cafeteria roenbergensis]